MGVYRKNMKMPEYCRVCHDRTICERYDGEILHRSDDCPLIEIDLVRCEECEWSNGECSVGERYQGGCTFGERRADETQP